jgi:hypothetical protein
MPVYRVVLEQPWFAEIEIEAKDVQAAFDEADRVCRGDSEWDYSIDWDPGNYSDVVEVEEVE